MISERTLKQWRRDALKATVIREEDNVVAAIHISNIEMKNRILRLTQELMDIYLLKKGS